MSLYVDPPFALGQTLGVTEATQGDNWVGVVKVFPDVDPTTGQVRSNRVKKCVAVRNGSGATLLGKRAVAFKDGSYTEVSGYKRTTGSYAAGVSDEYLPASGVAANDVFWVTVEGPTVVSVATAVAVGDVLVDNKTIAATAATDAASSGGQATTVNVTTAAASPKGSVIGRVLAGTTNTSPVVALVEVA